MQIKAVLLLAGIVAGAPAMALAGDMNEKSGGTLALAPDPSWAIPMEDEEMAEVRGGMAGLSFSVFFTGSVADLTFQPGSAPDVGDITISENQVQISSFLANTGNVNGIFQFTEVNGSLNVVNSHMTIQVAIFPAGSDPVPTTSIFGAPGGL